MWERVTNLVDLVFLLQEKHLILVARHDSQLLPPSMKSSDFGVLMFLSSWVIFVIFLGNLSTSSPKMEFLLLRRVTNLVHSVLLLEDKHLILLPQHDCQPFQPSMKCNAFGVLTLFVIFGNYCNLLVYLSTHSPKME